MEKVKILLGKIVATYGLKGQVKVTSNTDFASFRFKKGNKVTLINEKTNDSIEMKISSFKELKGMIILQFEKYEDINLVEKYINYNVVCDDDNLQLEDNQFHFSTLIGMQVYHKDNYIGQISDIIYTSAHYILRIKKEGNKDILYPFIERFIEKIDLDNNKLYLNPIEGLL